MADKTQMWKNLAATVVISMVLWAQVYGWQQRAYQGTVMVIIAAAILVVLFVYIWFGIGRIHVSFVITEAGPQVHYFGRKGAVFPWGKIEILKVLDCRGKRHIVLIMDGQKVAEFPYTKDNIRTILAGMIAYDSEFELSKKELSQKEIDCIKMEAETIRESWGNSPQA